MTRCPQCRAASPDEAIACWQCKAALVSQPNITGGPNTGGRSHMDGGYHFVAFAAVTSL